MQFLCFKPWKEAFVSLLVPNVALLVRGKVLVRIKITTSLCSTTTFARETVEWVRGHFNSHIKMFKLIKRKVFFRNRRQYVYYKKK